MAKVFKNIAQLQAAVDKYLYYAVDKVADEVQKKIEEFIKYYYQEFSPEQYQRLYKFLNSVVATQPKKVDNGWQVEVYIDTSIKYPSTWKGENWNMGNTAYFANMGRHGNTKVGDQKFWDDAIEEIQSPEFLNKFAEFLRAKGLNITIK